jgi:MYXO-CTERM domain-containing protein
MKRLLSTLALGFALSAFACGDVNLDPEHTHEEDFVEGWGAYGVEPGLAIPGRWEISSETEAIGNAQSVTYTGAPPYNGGANCAPGATAGALTFRDHMISYFPQISGVGIYNCRLIGGSSSMSIHGMGRALDIHIPLAGGEADNDLGDPVAQFLIENAEAIGIQAVIWDRSIWKSNRNPRHYDYGGQHPHHDHLHVELSVGASVEGTSWFDAPFGPVPCGSIPSASTILEDTHECFNVFGPAQYWRQEATGQGGSLYWTNAYNGTDASNWAQWRLNFDQPGFYEVEVYIDASFGVFDQTRYEVKASGVTTSVIVNQAASSGWKSLGTYEFSGDGNESVAVFDNYNFTVAADQHIVVDALKVSPVAPEACEALSAEGGVVSENGPCFELFGPMEYWRSEGGSGYEGNCLWTQAFENETPSNWARWNLPVGQSGEYEIQVYLEQPHAQYDAVRYEIFDGTNTEVAIVNQFNQSGWISVGTYTLQANQNASLTVYDNDTGAMSQARRIMVDAVQLVRVDEPCTSDCEEPEPEPEPEPTPAPNPSDLRPCTGMECKIIPGGGGKGGADGDDVDWVVDADEDPALQEQIIHTEMPVAAGGCSSTGNTLPLAFFLSLLGLFGLGRRRRPGQHLSSTR